MDKLLKSKSGKTALILLAIAFLAMVIGLILIGSVEKGFLALKYLGVSEVLKAKNADDFSGQLARLQAGTAIAAIITPLLFFASFLSFGYFFYQNNQQNKQQISALDKE